MRFYVPALLLLLTSCATSVEKQSLSLQQATSCCSSLQELPFKPISTAANKFKINSTSPAFEFDKGISYFSAFEIPSKSARTFKLKSYFNGMIISQYFDPIILVLDSNFQQITIGSVELQFVDSSFFGDTSAHMLGQFSVDQNAKYLVILTSKFENMAPVARTKPTGYGYMIGSIPIVGTTSGVSIPLKRSPTGTLLIEPIPGSAI